ncbi:MAG: T9SS type A sorting domain-containing protein [Bacteroidota bacterium]
MKPAFDSQGNDLDREKKKIFSSLPFILFIFIFFSFSSSLFAQDVNLVVNSPLCFTAIDGDPLFDEDHTANGEITVHSLQMHSGGSISHNDPLSPCPKVTLTGDPANEASGSIKIHVIGNFAMETGSFISAENQRSSGKGGDITLIVDGNFSMQTGSLITSSNLTGTSGDRSAGNIVVNLTGGNGTVVMDAGSEIRANSAHGNGGDIAMTANNNITINGFIFSKDESNQSGSGNNQAHGGFISIETPKTLTIGDTGIVSSRGFDAGADLVHLCGCEIIIYGLVESSSTGHGIPSDPPNHLNHSFRPDKNPNSTAGVEIWASSSLIIDNLNHHGQVNADLCCGGGTEGESYIDIFCKSGNITILGKNELDNGSVQATNFAVHANGAAGNSDNGGTITIKALNGSVIASGLAIQADGTIRGGSITVEARLDVDQTGGFMTARGRTGGNTTTGGSINIVSFTGNIVTNAASRLEATGTNVTGTIDLTACASTGFPPGTSDPAAVSHTGSCVGSPQLNAAQQIYVVWCGVGEITITKRFFGSPGQIPATAWEYTSTIPGHLNFTLPAGGGSVTFTGVPNGNYTVTEIEKESAECPDQHLKFRVSNTCQATATDTLVATISVTGCLPVSCTFNNLAPTCQPDNDCQWCTKSAVQSQVWQNPGGMDPARKCLVPDILVDIRLPHTADNNVVTASEIGTNVPATWSIQAAVDYANAHKNDAAFTTDEIFIGVTATDAVAIDPTLPTSCGKSCGRPLAGDSPLGIENVVVTNTSTVRMNIFGCSVSLKGADCNLPVITVKDGVGKVTILDLHVWNSKVQGYLVKNNASLVVVKNSSAYYNDLGYDVQDDNVQVSGAQHMRFNRIGALIQGSNNPDVLRTNSDITNNTEAGIKITGNNNETNGNEVGTSGKPNAVGIIVTGNNNNLHDDKVTFNTGNGIYVTGANNTLHQEDAHSNGQNGISADQANGASGNKLDGNKAQKNTKQGIRACGQVNNGGNQGTDNLVEPQVVFSCPDPATAKFSVVDINTDKAYKYDPTFNLISATSFVANNSDANDEVASGVNSYVLDKGDKQIYRYIGVTAISKVLKTNTGASLNTPSGMAIDGDTVWVVDAGLKAIYRYYLPAAFSGAGNLNADKVIALTGNNGNAEGLAVDAGNLAGYLYVLDNADKQFYRYRRSGGAGTASKVLKDVAGSSLSNPSGAALSGADMWIVDNGKDKAYKYALGSLFGAGNLNAASEFALFAQNLNATGISIGNSTNLLRPSAPALLTEEFNYMPVRAYPNPAHNMVIVEFSSISKVKFNLKLVDITGRIVMSYDGIASGRTYHEFNVSKLAKGSYVIVLERENTGKELKKIVVQ